MDNYFSKLRRTTIEFALAALGVANQLPVERASSRVETFTFDEKPFYKEMLAPESCAQPHVLGKRYSNCRKG